MAPDRSVESADTPETTSRPSRGYRLTIRSIMVFVVLFALGFGFVVNQTRNVNQAKAVEDRTLAWINRLFLEQSMAKAESAYGVVEGYFSCDWEYNGYFTTEFNHLIVIKVRVHSRSSGPEGQIEFSSEGQTITWPIEDIEKARKINLKAEFPKAFR
jgi:hypothetical protein